MAAGTSTCPRCGATPSGPNVAEQAERIRLRLQEAIGDSYRLIELLGRGGMGIVFRALELALDREVALKVLALDPVLSPEAYARFEREAKLAARLDHPNVVPIFAVGQRNTVAYYTMRLVRGGTLEDMLEGHRSLDFVHATEILRDVASALDYAHGQGVVHRDIKPANVLISDSGHAMVSDFGIARGLGVNESALASGAVIGSPGYMSPEQWRGEEIDARADQYALGVMAFEMLTGHRPFETVRVQDLLKLHLTAEVPNASSIKPSLPPFVDLAIKRAMHKNSTARFATTSSFVEALAGRRPVATGTRTSVPIIMEPAQTGGLSPSTKMAIALTFVGLAIIAGVVGVMHPGVLPIFAPAAPLHTDTTPNPPDSVLNVDTTFDLNASSPPNARTHGRAPVAVDPTLFPAQAAGPDANADASAYIHVTVRGGAARVRIDGQMYGFTPLVVRVDPGPHIVSLESSGDAFLPGQITVNTMPNDTSVAVFAARVTGNGGLDMGPGALSAPGSGTTVNRSALTAPQNAAMGAKASSSPSGAGGQDSGGSSLPPSSP